MMRMAGWRSRWSAWRTQRTGYSGARPDVVAAVKPNPSRVLDVGCGAGLTAALLKERFGDVFVVGVEPSPELARSAISHVDQVLPLSIDDPECWAVLGELAAFDVVICADVLEHLPDPQSTLRRLVGLLAQGGIVVTSIPNVRHMSTFFSLGLLGDWPLRERGIHDATHLRFFARRNILRLGAACGLKLDLERRNLRLVESWSWTMIPAKALDFWPLRPFFTFQYIHRWSRQP